MAFQKLRSPRVYIPNKSFHDFEPARKFGELVFLTEGIVNRTKINTIARQVASAMEDARAGDYIMISGLSVINSIASAIFASKFGRLNFLFHDQRTNTYESRSIVLNALDVENPQMPQTETSDNDGSPKTRRRDG